MGRHENFYEGIQTIDILFQRLNNTAAAVKTLAEERGRLSISFGRIPQNKTELYANNYIMNGIIEILNSYEREVKIVSLNLSLFSMNQENILERNEEIEKADFEADNVVFLGENLLPFDYDETRLFLSYKVSQLVTTHQKDFDAAGFWDNDDFEVVIPLNRILEIVIELK
jgi:hypothetical protein